MEDLISVIVPVYNVEAYLKECLDSLVQQTYKNIEILLIDDGSTDASGTICDAYATQDSRIAVYHRKNSGPSASRNYGIRIAKGEYLVFTDSDDCIHPELIEQLYTALKVNQVQLACCDYLRFENAEDILQNTKSRMAYIKRVLYKNGLCDDAFDFARDSIRLPQLQAIKYLFDMNKYRFISCNKLFSRDLFQEVRYPEGKCYEDILPIYLIFKKLNSIAYLPRPLYYYRVQRKSITQQPFNPKEYDLLEYIRMVSEDCINHFPEATDYAAVANIYYCLSVMNKAILSGTQLPEEEIRIRTDIKRSVRSLRKVEGIGFARKMQVYLYLWSPLIYRCVYLSRIRRSPL